MTDTLITESLNRPVEIDELKRRVSDLQFFDSMRVITTLSCAHPWMPETPQVRALMNSVNLSLLAKAFALWSSPSGRRLTVTGSPSDEPYWLLRAVNSLRWYSRDAFKDDRDNTLVAYLVRQAYLVYTLNDPVDGMIARNFIMFYDLVRKVDVPVKNISAELQRVVGVGCEDLWAIVFCLYAFYFLQHKLDPSKWVVTTNFFSDTSRNDELNGKLQTILARIARSQEQLQKLYESGPKYKDKSGKEGAWLSEFNILRDYPVVELHSNVFCCPFPVFSFQRGAVGFYYDLLEDYADQERAKNQKNNPYRNPMSMTFQLLFQRYVGLQLEQLPGADAYLTPEFKYGAKNATADSPDWVLTRPGQLPVLFECKARRPALVWQSQAQPEQLDADIKQTVAYAMNQVSKFIKRADQGVPKTEYFKGIPKVIFALVMHDPFPFHAIPDLAARIERVAKQEAPDWEAISPRIVFVPMSIRELETAVGLEILKGIPIEKQFAEYAAYRRTATRYEVIGDTIRFPRHLEEFLQETWNDSRRISNPLIGRTWDRFADHVHRHLYDEPLENYESQLRRLWIAENAYFRWWNEGRPGGQALRHWLDAENEFLALEDQFGMPPYQAVRLVRYNLEDQAGE